MQHSEKPPNWPPTSGMQEKSALDRADLLIATVRARRSLKQAMRTLVLCFVLILGLGVWTMFWLSVVVAAFHGLDLLP